ncbi:MAG: 30S ribosomal protein S18 [Candidatus Daviesbacteria bacterium]|nr:30S ribosomal protein S18 [Candidatus Daviesbacteria bacterium]
MPKRIIKSVGRKVEREEKVATPAASSTSTATPGVITKKVCSFCHNKTEPSYVDTAALRRFMSDRGRINSKQRSGLCSKHQRRATLQIKYARHLSMLPFTLGA